jgi:hypothetical protein
MAEIKFCDSYENIPSEAVRRMNWEQALASARIEGFEPGAEYLADVEKNILGELTDEEFREKYITRAKIAGSKA